MTPIRKTMNRVRLHTVRDPRAKFQLYRSRQYWVCLITSQKSSKFFPIFDQNWPLIDKKRNRVPLHIGWKPHAEFQLDQFGQSGLSLITSKISNLPIFAQKWPPSEKQWIGFVYTPLGTHVQNFSFIGPDSIEFAWLQAKNPKNIKILHFPHLWQKLTPPPPPSTKKRNRVPLHIGWKPHAEFQLDQSRQSGLSLITSKISNLPIFAQKWPPSEKQWIGFVYTPLGTHVRNSSFIGPDSIEFAWLQAKNPQNIKISHFPHCLT